MHGIGDVDEAHFQDESANANCAETDSQSAVASFEQSSMDVILQEMSSLVKPAHPVVIAVLCEAKGNSCKSFDALKKDGIQNREIVQIWACDREHLHYQSQDMHTCEEDMKNNLLASIASNGKINGLIIDLEVSRAVGQILHKVLADVRLRDRVLRKQYTVLTPTLNPDESWRKNLLDRFRTEFVKVSPAHSTEIYFSNSSASMKVGVFSSGDQDFYSNLVKIAENSEEKTGLVVQINEVKDGVLNFRSHAPSVLVTNEDYDKQSATEQWRSQHPLGLQTIQQFDIQSPLRPLGIGEEVLVNDEVNVWTGTWGFARIIEHNEDGTYNIVSSWGEEESVPRHLLREWEDAEDSILNVGERILILEDDGIWYQGSVLAKLEGDLYKVQNFSGDGESTIIDREFLMKQMEPLAETAQTVLSIEMMKDVLESTPVSKGSVTVHNDTGDGFLLTGTWQMGRVIILWDGKSHIDLNLYTYNGGKKIGDLFKNVFVNKIPGLSLSSRDEQPRGFGRVVNLDGEIQSPPEWVSSNEMME